MRLVVGVTGASGAIYAKRLLEVLKEKNVEVDLIVTAPAEYIMQNELGLTSKELGELATAAWDIADIAADVASGSQPRDGLVVIPCTMDAVAKMAHGISDNLLLRCFDVMLKENRKIIIVPRETPLHATHLENLLRLRRLGVTIIPPMTSFYHKPQTVMDMVDFIIAKILDQFNIPNALIARWKKPEVETTQERTEDERT
ncbi:MAG: UbiX family flavin prenyltransferase [Methanomicrobia archaeon]|nr:UbiX family flavin prenyltransferase [Methanomicrobia archaeon]